MKLNELMKLSIVTCVFVTIINAAVTCKFCVKSTPSVFSINFDSISSDNASNNILMT